MATVLKQVTPVGRGRYYETPDGRRFPSVTSVLACIGKPALITWAANMERELVLEAAANLNEDLPINVPRLSRPSYIASLKERLGKQRAHEKLKQHAADIGSQAHERVEWELRTMLKQKAGPEPVVKDAALWAFMAWQDWWKSAGLTPVWIEQMVWSSIHGYAGTMDLLAKDARGNLVVVDLKTSKSIYAEAELQTAAYGHAVEEMGHGIVGRGLIVRLPKTETDPAFEVREVPSLTESFRVFQHVMELHLWQADNDAKWRAAHPVAE